LEDRAVENFYSSSKIISFLPKENDPQRPTKKMKRTKRAKCSTCATFSNQTRNKRGRTLFKAREKARRE
jgi:hypothetical protein